MPTFSPNLTVREAIENELTEFKEAHERYNKLINELANNPDDKNIQEEIHQITTFLDLHNLKRV